MMKNQKTTTKTRKMEEILVVEDKPEEMDYAVELLEQRGIKSSQATTLVDGLRTLKKKPAIPIVLTDVMYPVGGKIKDEFRRNCFYESLGFGLVSASTAYWGASSRDEEMIKYACLIGNFKDWIDDMPSGVVLGLCAMKQSRLPVFISSHEHHHHRTDGLVTLCRLGIFSEDLFIEGINSQTGKKKWEEAVDKVTKALEDSAYLDGLVRRMQEGKKRVCEDRPWDYPLYELLTLPDHIDGLFKI